MSPLAALAGKASEATGAGAMEGDGLGKGTSLRAGTRQGVQRLFSRGATPHIIFA